MRVVKIYGAKKRPDFVCTVLYCTVLYLEEGSEIDSASSTGGRNR